MVLNAWRKTLSEDKIKKQKPLKVYVGWDSREPIAFEVCKASILKHATVPVKIVPLKRHNLVRDNMYWREEDALASTEFTFTRFLVPDLMGHRGWALFIDCDFLFLTDIKELFDQVNDNYAVMCVHHDYTPKEGEKMDGQKQINYPRKNWSSAVLWNCGHPDNKVVDKELVNDPTIDGKYMHRFSWLTDDKIGKISHEWNWLVGWYKPVRDGQPKALHYTEGGPWFDQYRNCPFSKEWYEAQAAMYEDRVKELTQEVKDLKNRTVEIDELTLPKETKTLLNAYLQNLIDPTEAIYKSKETIKHITEKRMGVKVAAIAPGADDFDLDKKGLEYDPYLQDFIIGCGGNISEFNLQEGTKNTLVIRGLGGGSQKALKYCIENKVDYYAIDTGYLQPGSRKDYHRVTRNNLQNLGPIVDRDLDRLGKLNWKWRKPRKNNKKILICPPSEKVMKFYGENLDEWLKNTVDTIKTLTNAPIEIRKKPDRRIRVTTDTIWDALDTASCLVTYNSIAATEAVLHSIPAIALAPNAASVLCSNNLRDVVRPEVPEKEDVIRYAAHLSYCQFTAQELRTGTAWKLLNS